MLQITVIFCCMTLLLKTQNYRLLFWHCRDPRTEHGYFFFSLYIFIIQLFTEAATIQVCPSTRLSQRHESRLSLPQPAPGACAALSRAGSKFTVVFHAVFRSMISCSSPEIFAIQVQNRQNLMFLGRQIFWGRAPKFLTQFYK